jgi:hypothetical protein
LCYFGYFQKELPKGNKRSISENWPNLVTLLPAWMAPSGISSIFGGKMDVQIYGDCVKAIAPRT